MLAMKTKNATKPGNLTASRTLDAGLSSPSHPPVTATKMPSQPIQADGLGG